jgi:hypothetical protein
MRHSLTVAGALGLLIMATPVLAKPQPRPEAPMSQLDLADLEDLGTFTVTLSGSDQPAFPDGTPCLYAEAVYGERHGTAWTFWSQVGSTREPLVVHTPKGDLTLTPNRLRLYLEPGYARQYQPQQAAEAPEVMRDDLAASDKPLDIVTYKLTKGRQYHARIDREGYYLPPPKGSGKPEKRFNRVMILSDTPFDRKPAKPATPMSGSIVY